MPAELAKCAWWERVDRDQWRDRAHGREYADAVHGFLAAVHNLPGVADGWSTPWFDGEPATPEQTAALREFRDELGRISGAGPFPQ